MWTFYLWFPLHKQHLFVVTGSYNLFIVIVVQYCSVWIYSLSILLLKKSLVSWFQLWSFLYISLDDHMCAFCWVCAWEWNQWIIKYMYVQLCRCCQTVLQNGFTNLLFLPAVCQFQRSLVLFLFSVEVLVMVLVSSLLPKTYQKLKDS